MRASPVYLLTVAAACLQSIAGPVPANAEISESEEAREFVAVLLPESQPVERFTSTYALAQPTFTVYRVYETINGFSAEVTPAVRAQLEAIPGAHVESDIILTPQLDDSLPQINVPHLWIEGADGEPLEGQGQSICVIDTGIDREHPAFAGRIREEGCSCRLEDQDGTLCCPNDTDHDDRADDATGHGTHVTSIAAGYLYTYRGVAPRAGILAFKVCSDRGYCSGLDILEGIEWCLSHKETHNVVAINISLGGGRFYEVCDNYAQTMATVVNAAAAAGMTIVAAAANSGWSDSISLPACLSNIVAVGGVNGSDEIRYNRAPFMDLLAPGVGIQAARNGGGTRSGSGTSMASPHVAGAMVLLHELLELRDFGPLHALDLEQLLAETGVPVADPESGYTYSRIDVGAAAEALRDCNSNGIPDPCDLACGERNRFCDWPGCGMSADCNEDDVPDECQLAGQDCNSNGVLDMCDPGCDADQNGVLDRCEAPLACDPPSTAHCPHADMDCSGEVNAFDLLTCTASCNFGMTVDLAAMPRCDLDADGIITGLDVARITSSGCFGM